MNLVLSQRKPLHAKKIDALMAMSIQTFARRYRLDSQLKNALFDAHYLYLGQVARESEDTIKAVWGIGETLFTSLKRTFKKVGLEFGMKQEAGPLELAAYKATRIDDLPTGSDLRRTSFLTIGDMEHATWKEVMTQLRRKNKRVLSNRQQRRVPNVDSVLRRFHVVYAADQE